MLDYAKEMNKRILNVLSNNRIALTDKQFNDYVDNCDLTEHFSAIINKSFIVELISYDDNYILEISHDFNYMLYNISQIDEINKATFTHFYLCDNIFDAYARINNAILISLHSEML
jgi:tRNA(Ile2) C34 agmatinyltransferase TiaS